MLLILNSFYASYINVQYEKKEQKYLPSNRNLTIIINYWIIDVNAVQGIFMKLVGCSKESLVVNCILNMLYTVIYTVIHWFFLSKGKEKKYISLTASKVTQLFFLFDSQLIRHWNRTFLPITRRLSYLHTQRFSAKLKTIIPKNFLESIVFMQLKCHQSWIIKFQDLMNMYLHNTCVH